MIGGLWEYRSLVGGKKVLIDPKERDRYGRNVADVYVSRAKCLNHALVRAGLAWWYERYAPGDQVLRRLQAQARRERRGLWSRGNAMAPWKWRRKAE
mgnify:CR=1 FL=1